MQKEVLKGVNASMKLSAKYKLINVFFGISIGLLIIISLYIIVFVSGQWEEEYKKELQQKYDRDYYKASLKVDENDTGEYFQDTKNIIIYTKNREIGDVKRTAIHEICHYLYFEFLNDSQKEEWKLLHNNSVSANFLNDSDKLNLLTNGSSFFVSDYAEKHEVEDFAESCSAFVLWWNKLDFRKELFMKKYVEGLI